MPDEIAFVFGVVIAELTLVHVVDLLDEVLNLLTVNQH
jgi:hypothetical protein